MKTHKLSGPGHTRTPDLLTRLPTFQIARGYAKEVRRLHPTWSLHECVMEGYTLATEAMNPRNER